MVCENELKRVQTGDVSKDAKDAVNLAPGVAHEAGFRGARGLGRAAVDGTTDRGLDPEIRVGADHRVTARDLDRLRAHVRAPGAETDLEVLNDRRQKRSGPPARPQLPSSPACPRLRTYPGPRRCRCPSN
jgi:hypothetical protein